MRKAIIYSLIITVLLALVYLSGPSFHQPQLSADLPELTIKPNEFEDYLRSKNAQLKIKPDNESRVIWANDSLKNKTEFCLLYLHGFSSSWYEGEPVHRDFATRYSMNLYLPLLASHGIESTDALLDMTPDKLYNSAKEALVAAHILGNKVILMSTSTGGTLSLKLASEYPELVDGLILLSPNVAINNSKAFLLSKPWGLQIARTVFKSKYRTINPDFNSAYCRYWNCRYRLEAAVYLQQLVDATMNKKVFSRISKPVFLGYYFKDEINQDDVVRVDAMLEMFELLSTNKNMKVKMAFPNAGTHPIGSKLLSAAWQDVERAMYNFAEDKLGLIPITKGNTDNRFNPK